MSETKIRANAKYLLRGDTAENWEKAGNPTLAEREPGVLLDENRCFVGLKIGDGKKPWNELPLHKFGEAEKNYNPKSFTNSLLRLSSFSLARASLLAFTK